MDDGKKREAIFSLIADVGKLDRSQLTPEMNLRKELGLDSLTLVNLLMRCGEELGIDPDDLIETIPVETIHTVGDVVAMGASLHLGQGRPR